MDGFACCCGWIFFLRIAKQATMKMIVTSGKKKQCHRTAYNFTYRYECVSVCMQEKIILVVPIQY